ncbi:DUF1643 domain-containing protein [Microvirga sp. Mcv34]|uniref:DUF1643 domain-containing protein n=1 Tax=Microvirga sp. Mcv34 TaxID=2926016 RepID=UPI0021C643AC|nr:DUF1643 domain-containing protein [Microvirga sp. Mcv34]
MTDTTHDPGGKVRLSLPCGVSGAGGFSDCGRYRQTLIREIGQIGDARGPFVLFVGMNPSTADATVDDPTVRREWGFARRLGFSRYVKANVMDYRATDPKDLLAPGVEPRSAENLPEIVRLAKMAGLVVMAFGALPKPLRHYANETVSALREAGVALHCLGYTADGSPRHPLYLRSDAPLLPFPREGDSPARWLFL